MVIEFIYDETQEELEKLNKLLDNIKRPKTNQELNARFLKNFMKAAFEGYIETKTRITGLRAKDYSIKPKTVKLLKEEIPLKEYNIIKIGNIKISVIIDDTYELIEPSLTETDKSIINTLLKNKTDFKEKDAKKLAKNYKIKPDQAYIDKIRYYYLRNKRFGKIDPLLLDKNVTGVYCDNLNTPVRISYGIKDKETNIRFDTKQELDKVIKSLAKHSNQVITQDDPLINGILESGHRFQALLGQDLISSSFSIRK